MSWLDEAERVGRLGVDGILAALVIILYRRYDVTLTALLAAKDEIANVKGMAAEKMIALLKALQDAGMISTRMKPPPE